MQPRNGITATDKHGPQGTTRTAGTGKRSGDGPRARATGSGQCPLGTRPPPCSTAGALHRGTGAVPVSLAGCSGARCRSPCRRPHWGELRLESGVSGWGQRGGKAL